MYLVQSVLFNKQLWNLTESKQWLKENGYICRKVDEKPHFLRFRQRDPKKLEREGYKFRTKKLGKSGIELIIAYKDSLYKGLGLMGEEDSSSDEEMVGGMDLPIELDIQETRKYINELLDSFWTAPQEFFDDIISEAITLFDTELPRIRNRIKKELGHEALDEFNQRINPEGRLDALLENVKDVIREDRSVLEGHGRNNFCRNNIMIQIDKKRAEGQRHLEGKIQSRQKSDKTLRSPQERVLTEQQQRGSSVNERTLYYY